MSKKFALTNINLMTKQKYDALPYVSDAELYAIKAAVIIDAYQSGSSWYRLYSDGWCEQGGILSWNGSWTNVTLLKSYVDTNYTVLGGGYRTDSTAYQCTFNFKDWTTDSFKIWASDDTTNNESVCKWYACGYTS